MAMLAHTHTFTIDGFHTRHVTEPPRRAYRGDHPRLAVAGDDNARRGLLGQTRDVLPTAAVVWRHEYIDRIERQAENTIHENSWFARQPPEPKVVGSNPTGRTKFSACCKLATWPKSLSR